MISGVSAVSFSAPKSQNNKQIKPVAQQRFLGAQQEYSSSVAFTSMGKAQVAMNQGNVNFKGADVSKVIVYGADKSKKAIDTFQAQVEEKAPELKEAIDNFQAQMKDKAPKAKKAIDNLEAQALAKVPEVEAAAAKLGTQAVDRAAEVKELAENLGDKVSDGADKAADKVVDKVFDTGRLALNKVDKMLKKNSKE